MGSLIKDLEDRRDFILNDNIWTVSLKMGLPLVFYNSVSQIFGFFDTLIAASMGGDIVSIISFVFQLKAVFIAISGGLSVGGEILIARVIGARDYDKKNRIIARLFFINVALLVLILATVIPFASDVLRLFNLPGDLYDPGIDIFRLEMLNLFFIFINNLYFAVDRASGHTGRILYWNILIFSVKLVCNVILIFGFKTGPLGLSFSSIISQGVVFVFVSVPFLYSIRYFIRRAFSKEKLSPDDGKLLLSVSAPIFLEKFMFNYGKTVVNSMSAEYGSTAIGALGVSNRIGGLATMPPIGFKEAEATIVSQSIGDKNYNRAFKAFETVFLINLVIGVFFFILMSVLKDNIISLFANGNVSFAMEIERVYNYERYATVFLAVSSSIMGFLYGLGYTKLSMTINIMRLFVFRIPSLWYFQNFTSLGIEGLGLAMMISNIMTGISALLVMWVILRRRKRRLEGFSD